MKKQLLTLFGAFALFNATVAQNDKSKMMPCGTFDAMEEAFKADPKLRENFIKEQAKFEAEYQMALASNNSASKVAATVYTVPVVFHVMGQQNISDQVFIDFIANVNKDYAKLGSDTGTINSVFRPLYKDVEIRFALAQKDPNGNCTNGIIRHPNDNKYWSQTSSTYAYSGSGAGKWATNKYLNVYVVECISSATYSCPTTGGAYLGGYTYLPGTWGTNASQDAIVYLSSLLGQTDSRDSRTLSHEIGHWLNLSHTFGSTNNPGTTCGDDNVSDTPPTKGNFSTCPSSIGTNTCDASGNQNVENIMDYASCPKMFTQGQITRMRTAIQSTTSGRNNLWTNTNYLATGLIPTYTCTPVADFNSNKTKSCTGYTVAYNSLSQVGASGGVTWTFEGGTPATSTATNPVVTYAAPGTYSVSITATNSIGSNTKNSVSYISISNSTGGSVLPNAQNFETTGIPSGYTVVNPNSNVAAWNQITTTGASSTAKSMYLNNSAATGIAGHIDILESPLYDFSNTTNITFSYYYAYAKKVAAQVDTFRIQYSLDCGGTWSNMLGTSTTAQMAAASGGTLSTAFTPSSTQWIQKTIVPTLLTALNNKPSVKFRYYFRVDPTKTTANNMYLDQINITGNVTTAITDLEKSMELAIYPNPTSSSSVVEFNLYNNEKVKLTVTDLVGRVVETSETLSPINDKVSYTVNRTNNLAKGVYIVSLDVNNQRISKKLIIE